MLRECWIHRYYLKNKSNNALQKKISDLSSGNPVNLLMLESWKEVSSMENHKGIFDFAELETFNTALEFLLLYSIITIDPIRNQSQDNEKKLAEDIIPMRINVHRLTQQVIRLNHKKNGVYERNYENVFDWVVSHMDYDGKDLQDVERAGLLVPHGMYLESLRNTLEDQRMAELLGKIGRHQLYGIGKYDVALKYS